VSVLVDFCRNSYAVTTVTFSYISYHEVPSSGDVS
jgi:hypothetical protein